MEETTLAVKVTVTNADGNRIVSRAANDDQVAFVNNTIHSLFKEVEVHINGKRIKGGDNTYPYKLYLASVFRF